MGVAVRSKIRTSAAFPGNSSGRMVSRALFAARPLGDHIGLRIHVAGLLRAHRNWPVVNADDGEMMQGIVEWNRNSIARRRQRQEFERSPILAGCSAKAAFHK